MVALCFTKKVAIVCKNFENINDFGTVDFFVLLQFIFYPYF